MGKLTLWVEMRGFTEGELPPASLLSGEKKQFA